MAEVTALTQPEIEQLSNAVLYFFAVCFGVRILAKFLFNWTP